MKHITCVGKCRSLTASTSAFYMLEHPHIWGKLRGARCKSTRWYSVRYGARFYCEAVGNVRGWNVRGATDSTTMHVRRRFRIRTSETTVLFPYSSWCCRFTQILFSDLTHRELYCKLYCITALFLHVWHYHASCQLQYIRRRADVLHAYASVLSGTI